MASGTEIAYGPTENLARVSSLPTNYQPPQVSCYATSLRYLPTIPPYATSLCYLPTRPRSPSRYSRRACSYDTSAYAAPSNSSQPRMGGGGSRKPHRLAAGFYPGGRWDSSTGVGSGALGCCGANRVSGSDTVYDAIEVGMSGTDGGCDAKKAAPVARGRGAASKMWDQVLSAIRLRARYAMSGTGIAYGATGLCARAEVYATDIATGGLQGSDGGAQKKNLSYAGEAPMHQRVGHTKAPMHQRVGPYQGAYRSEYVG
eukprot:827278-Rhodomonas_salina.10